MKLCTALFIVACLVSGPAPVFSPPSVAAASPLPIGYFPVAFDSDKADLSAETQKFIDDVAHGAVNHGDQLVVIDEAKNLGISDYDRALSDRRAKAIVVQLVAEGIPRSMIKIYYVDKFHADFSGAGEIHEYVNRHVVVLAPYTPPPPPPPGVIVVP